nr:hypothetical protein [Tanacetum cinerariifolium]
DEDDNDDDGDNDDNSESDDHDDDSDDERTTSDSDEIPDPNLINELYEDVNVNLENDDAEMTDANQGGSEQQNVSQESGFEQEEEDAHVTLTSFFDAQKADEPFQSSPVSSDFTSKFLNLENPSLANNEKQTPTITTPTFTTITSINPTVTLPKIPNFASIFKFDQRVSVLEYEMSELKQTNQFAKVVSLILGIVDKYLASKMKEAMNVTVQLQTNKLREEAQAKNQDFLNQTAYVVAVSLLEFKLKKILIDKMETNKSINRSDTQKNLYNALVDSYNSDKEIITSYGDVVLLKIGRDDQDKDEDPFAGSDQRTKIRKSSKDAESSKYSRYKEKKSSSTSKDASQSQHKSSGKCVHAEEPSHTVEESGMQQNQEIIAVTRLTILKKYDYGYLEEIEVRRDDQQLYTFTEGDFKRLRLQDIEVMLLLLVQQKLTNLTIDEHYDLNVALRMFTRYKKKARVMVQDIDKQLYQMRLMRNLEMIVGGRIYRKDLRLLERTI